MAWKPKLPPVGTEVVPMDKRPWVAVAEAHAEQAVNLFVNIMKNQHLSYKMRMEAATRIVMIAGATFRGEKRDGNGRPAANLPTGTNITRLGHDALREALKQLPPNSVLESPEELAEGEMAVVLFDGEHQRKPTGKIIQTTLGSIVAGEADPEEAHALQERRLQSREEEEVVKLAKKAEALRVPKNAEDVMKKLFQFKAKEKRVLEIVDKKLGIKGDELEYQQMQAKSLLPRGDGEGDGSGGTQAGQVNELDSSASLEDSQGNGGEVPKL
jgi:hypothetical protein